MKCNRLGRSIADKFVGLVGAGGELGFLHALPIFAIFLFREPIKVPAEAIKQLPEEFTAIDVLHVAHAREDPFHIAFTVGGETISSFVAILAHAFAGINKPRINYCSNEWYSFIYWFVIDFLRMEGKL